MDFQTTGLSPLDSPIHSLGSKLQSKGMILLATPDLLNWIIWEWGPSHPKVGSQGTFGSIPQ